MAMQRFSALLFCTKEHCHWVPALWEEVDQWANRDPQLNGGRKHHWCVVQATYQNINILRSTSFQSFISFSRGHDICHGSLLSKLFQTLLGWNIANSPWTQVGLQDDQGLWQRQHEAKIGYILHSKLKYIHIIRFTYVLVHLCSG